jgi:hypothetical protein
MVNMSEFRWTWKHQLGLLWYNHAKRHWQNARWLWVRYTDPECPKAFSWRYPRFAKLDRADFEWAHNTFRELAQTDEFKNLPRKLREQQQ